MVTIDDIAREADVNKTTVSRALRGDTGLNAQTVKKICEIARSLGYRPKKRRINAAPLVGVICPEVDSGFYSRIVTSLSNKLISNGCECFFSISGFEQQRERELLKFLTEKRFSGIICITESKGLSSTIRKCLSDFDIPIIQIALNIQTGDHDNIWVDEAVGVNTAVEHLISLGHKRIAFIGDKLSDMRLKYFASALKAGGLAADDRLIKISEQRHFQCGYDMMALLVEQTARPTAIIAEYDDVALGAMRLLKERNYRVPEDFSVIGFDNVGYCPYLFTSMTTIDSHSDSMIEIAATILMKKINDPTYRIVQNVLIKPDLIIRESTGTAKHTR